MGNWNMKTLSYMSYNRAANIWIQELMTTSGTITCETTLRMQRKLEEMKSTLDIPQKYVLDALSIKQKIDKEWNKPGYWTMKDGIHDGENALIMTKWQLKYNSKIYFKAC